MKKDRIKFLQVLIEYLNTLNENLQAIRGIDMFIENNEVLETDKFFLTKLKEKSGNINVKELSIVINKTIKLSLITNKD